jgi:hypothetical protein
MLRRGNPSREPGEETTDIVGFGPDNVQSEGRILLGFDASKLKDDLRMPDPDSSSLISRLPDVGSRVAVDVAIPRSMDLTAIARGWDRDALLASRSLVTLENPLLRAFVGISSRSTLEAARPSGALGWGTSALGYSSLFKSLSKFGSLAVVESQASAALHASTMRGIADSFRNLDPLKESTSRFTLA